LSEGLCQTQATKGAHPSPLRESNPSTRAKQDAKGQIDPRDIRLLAGWSPTEQVDGALTSIGHPLLQMTATLQTSGQHCGPGFPT
jgi:hypothetical protein